MKKLLYIIILTVAVVMASCKPKDDPKEDVTTYSGLYVLNEGNYTYANASLTYYDPETDSVVNNLFYRVNGSPIGDVGQSLAQKDGYLYIVVNNSNYIYKTDLNTVEYKAKLTDFISPRYMKFITDKKAYVTDIIAKGVWVINPKTMTHTKFIETGKPTENMLVWDNKLYVTNWSKYYAPEINNNTVQIIDIATDQKIGEIEVGVEPNSIVLDKNNNIWVMCGGGYDMTEKARLFCIDPTIDRIVNTYEFAEYWPTNYPSFLNIDNTGSVLYYIDNGKVYTMSVDATELPSQPFLSPGEGGLFYNMYVDPTNGDLYVSDSKNFMTNGEVCRYTSSGTFITSFAAGIGPSFMMLKEENK